MGGPSGSGGSEDREEKKIPTYADQLKKGVNISHGPEGSGKYKLTDKGLEKSPTFLEKSIIGRAVTGFKDSKFNKKNTIGLRKDFFEGKKRTLDKRIKTIEKTLSTKYKDRSLDETELDERLSSLKSQRAGLDKTSFGVGKQSDDYWLSDAGGAELKAHGLDDFLTSRQAGGTGFDGRTSDRGQDIKGISTKSIEQPKVASQMDNAGIKSDMITAKGPTSTEISDEYSALRTKRKGRKSTILTSVTGIEAQPTLGKKTLLG